MEYIFLPQIIQDTTQHTKYSTSSGNTNAQQQPLSKNEKEEKENAETDKKRNVIMAYLFGVLLIFLHSYIIYVNVKGLRNIIVYILLLNIGVLFSNLYFSYIDELNTYGNELNLYQYVEDNGRVLVTASLANALFLKVIMEVLNKKNIGVYTILVPIIISFIYAISVLVIVWMPKNNGKYIRTLRDLKTTFLTNSIFTLILSMFNILFVFTE